MNDLSEKLKAAPDERVIRIDFGSFSEPEKVLIRKIWDLQEEHGDNLPPEVLEANKELVFKANEVLFRYVVNTLKFTLLCFMGDPEDEIHRWYFNLHFHNFFLDLFECLQRVQKWPEKEREWFLGFLKEDGAKDRVFRFPESQQASKKQNEKAGEHPT